jgi:hypothetical protein
MVFDQPKLPYAGMSFGNILTYLIMGRNTQLKPREDRSSYQQATGNLSCELNEANTLTTFSLDKKTISYRS